MKNDGDDETFNYAAPKRIVARGHSDAVRNFELKFLVHSTYTTYFEACFNRMLSEINLLIDLTWD